MGGRSRKPTLIASQVELQITHNASQAAPTRQSTFLRAGGAGFTMVASTRDPSMDWSRRKGPRTGREISRPKLSLAGWRIAHDFLDALFERFDTFRQMNALGAFEAGLRIFEP